MTEYRTPHVTLPATVHESALELPAIGQGTWYMGENLAPRRDEVRALQQGLARMLHRVGQQHPDARLGGDDAAQSWKLAIY